MKTLRRAAILLSLSAVFSCIALANSYSFITIHVPGSTGTALRGINNSGDIVGTYTHANSTLGFLYSGGTFSNIQMPGAIDTNPTGINSAGQIVGFYHLAGNLHGFLYVDGNFSTIDVPGATATQASGINDLGQIAGTFTDARGERGFLYLDGSFTTLDAPGATSTSVTGIDNAGEIVGTYTDTNSLSRGFLYSGGAFSSLETADAVNDAGQLLHFGIFSAIEAPGAQGKTYSAGIDNAGEIVGFYFDASGAVHGFLATPRAQSSLAGPTSSLMEARSGSATAFAGNPTAKVSSGAGPCDVNGSGAINVTDVQSIVNQALGEASAVSDLNSDHAINVVDIQVVMNAVLNLGCTPIGGQQGGGTVAHLTVQSGNGQVLCVLPSCTLQSWQPISVRATNASGNPVAGATVSWTVTNGQITLGGPTSTSSVTDSNGIATQALSETGILVWTANPFNSYNVNNIQATSNNISVTFTETQTLENPSSGSSEIEAEPPQFNGGSLGAAPLSAPIGTTLSIPIQEMVAGLDQASNGVPNIAIRLINQQSSPTLTCVTGANADPGSVLTDARGNASCYPIFSGSGTGTYYISIGGVAGGTLGNGAMYLAALGPLTFTSMAGSAAAVQIVSGNNQVVPFNQTLSPLVAKVVDGQGNIVIGQTMVWSVSPAGAATLPNGATQTDTNGEVTTIGRDPRLAGAARPDARRYRRGCRATPAVIGDLQRDGSECAYRDDEGQRRVSQTAAKGTQFASPLVVKLVTASGPAPNNIVQYQSTGPITLVGAPAFTDSTGQASITVKAGSSSGTATVTAIAGALTQTFTLTVQ